MTLPEYSITISPASMFLLQNRPRPWMGDLAKETAMKLDPICQFKVRNTLVLLIKRDQGFNLLTLLLLYNTTQNIIRFPTHPQNKCLSYYHSVLEGTSALY